MSNSFPCARISSEVTLPEALPSSSSLPFEGREERGGLGMHLVLLPVGLFSPPARPVSSERGGSATGRSSGARWDFCLFGSRSRRSPAACSAPSLVGSPSHHSMLCEVMSWESLRRPAPVSDPPGLPEFRLEKQGRIVGPAHGCMVLVTDLATGILALLPVRGQAVVNIVVVARLDRYLPMNGHVVIDCGLLTAVDLVVLALARCPGVSGCCLTTAAIFGICIVLGNSWIKIVLLHLYTLLLFLVDYCNSLYLGLPNYVLKKLQSIMNKSARLIFSVAPRVPTT